jgi:Zn-dependent protease
MINLQTKSTAYKINFSFFALIAIMILLRDKNIVILNLVGCMIHEFGHYLACKICKVKIKEVSFSCTGFCIRKLETKSLSYGNELFILSSGIVVNLLISIFIFIPTNEVLHLFGTVNLIIAAFNLLPIKGFDGLQIRDLIFARNVPLENFRLYYKFIKVLDIILFVILSLLFINHGNIIYIVPIAFIMLRKFEE